jgi:alpha-tubulin suppressor-like RCC1 family protein
VKVACGWRHSAAISEKGTLYTCGWSKYGQLGHGDNHDRLTMVRVEALKDYKVCNQPTRITHTLFAITHTIFAITRHTIFTATHTILPTKHTSFPTTYTIFTITHTLCNNNADSIHNNAHNIRLHSEVLKSEDIVTESVSQRGRF